MNKVILFAPVSGVLVSLESVPDPVFAQKMVGDGIAIDPEGDTTVVAPVDGAIMQIFDSNHAFSMTTKDGLEVLVHVGIDTVSLKGEGFTRLFSGKMGSQITAGTPIVKFDMSLLKARVKSMVTMLIITNMEKVGSFKKIPSDNVVAGTSSVAEIEL